ncbi:MAG: hypothetical protein DMG65_18225 [Candidatus Angelobacter sp. Gp1-AA117]|nr:MAG: hypothetical protein DMG65_18225 [Candidatus Angelobacter sp. Gp1-AA117]
MRKDIRLSMLVTTMRRVLVTVLALTIFCTLSLAQSTTQGAISGTVYDTNGAVVPNAQVVVHNNGTNAEQTATTDAGGNYRVNSLQPGTYTVTVSEKGFSSFKSPQVTIQVGSVTEVSPRLTVGTTETVEVSGEAPQINTTSPDFAPTVNQVAIENLPINGGRWSSFSLLTPAAVSNSSGFGLISFRGISVLLNNNTVDGADNNQAFFSEERGRTRIGYSTPQAAIEEFQVNTSNFSSEYGRAAGAVINTVTKSGTNNLHGELYAFDRDNGFGAINPFTTLTTQDATGAFNTGAYKPTDKRWITGFALGGPALKDKLFWHVTLDYYHRNFPGTAVPSRPATFFATPTCYNASPTLPFNGTTVCDASSTLGTFATRMSGANNLANDQANLNLWNADLAAMNTMLGPVPRTGESFILLPKIDWNISQKNHASFELNRMRWASPAGIQTQATNTNGIASFGNDFVKDTWGVAKLDTFFTANLSNEIRFQYGRDFEYEFTQQPTPYEVNNLVNTPTFLNPLGLPPQVSITNGFTFGVPSFLQRPAFPDESTTQVANTTSWSHGKHNVKFGMDVRHVNDLSQNLRNQFGSYSYGSLLAYFSDLNKPKTCGGFSCYNSNGFTQAFGPLGFEFSTNDYGFFVEDNWKLLNRLTLSLGVRYDYEQLPHVFNNLINPDIPQSAHLPRDQNNIGPRLGFAYDVFGNSKTVVRGGYGVFYGRAINSTIFSALTQTGVIAGAQSSFSFSPNSSGAPVFPQVFAAAPTTAGKPSALFFDAHFQAPEIQEMDFNVEQNLGWGTVLKLSYLGSMGRELPDFQDTNICTEPRCIGSNTFTITPGGALNISSITLPVYNRRIFTKYNAMTSIVSKGNSSYNAMVVGVEHRMSHHMQFGANYTWSHAIDFGQNESTFSDTNDVMDPLNFSRDRGNSIYDVRHRFVANAVMESPWKHEGWLAFLADNWQLSPIVQAQSGLPFSLVVSGSARGTDPTTSPAFSTAAGGILGTNAFPNFLVGRNSFRMPNTYVTDVRLAKFLKFREKYNLELSADFFNLANHVNVTSVANTAYFVSGGNTLTLPAAPNLSFNTVTNGNSNFAYSPRQIQVGARFKF